MDLSSEKGRLGILDAIKIFAKKIKRFITLSYTALSSTQRIIALLYITLLTGVFTGILAFAFTVAVAYMFYKKLKGSDAGKYNEFFILHLRQCYMLPLIFLSLALSFVLFDAFLSHTTTIPAYYVNSMLSISWFIFFINIGYYHLLLVINLNRVRVFKKPITHYFSPLKMILLSPVLVCKYFKSQVDKDE